MTKGKSKLFKSIIIGCVLVMSSGCSLLPEEEEALKPPLFKPLEENHETIKVKRGDIAKQIKGIAFFESTKTEYHQFKDSGGRVRIVNVHSGDVVEKGDVLIELELEGIELDIKRRQLDVEKSKIDLKQAQDASDTDNVKISRLELEIAQMSLDDIMRKKVSKQLIAQMDGQVVFVDEIKPGDFIEGGKILVTIADTSQLRLNYQGEANNLINAQVGMPVEIKMDSKNYVGEVVQTPSSAPNVENQQLRELYAKTLYIKMKDIPMGTEIGQTVDFVITTQKRTNTITIPKRGLRSYLGRNYVQVLEGKSITEIDVEKGIESSTEVEIIQGLKEDKQVILQ